MGECYRVGGEAGLGRAAAELALSREAVTWSILYTGMCYTCLATTERYEFIHK